MQLPEFNCPRCNSLKLVQKTEKEGGHEKIFIFCNACRWQKVVIEGDSGTISDYKQIERLKIRAQKDKTLNRVIDKKRKKLNDQ